MTIEVGVLAAFGAMIAWGVGDFLIQRSVKKIGVVECLAVIGVIGSLGLLPFIYSDLETILRPENATLLVGLGAITFIAAVLNFYAYKIGKLAVIEFVLELELPITVILATFFFREVLSIPQLLVVGLAFGGIALISLESLALRKDHFLEKGVLVAGTAALFMGVVNFLTASASRNVSPLLAIWAPWVVVTIISLFWISRKNSLKLFVHDWQRHRNLLLLTGVIDTLAWLLFAFAVNHQFVAITLAITESYPAVALMLGIHYNHEKMENHQFVGALIAIGASILLGLWV